MFKKILVPTDGTQWAESAIAPAVKFAKDNDATIVAISVAEGHPSPLLSDSDFFGSNHAFNEKAHDLAKDYVQKIADAARAENVPCETIALHAPRPDEAILKAAKQHSCDLIFMGSRGHERFTGLFHERITSKVVHHSPIPVLVYRAQSS
jgi:nucleotide-binding universal stress UspA family protein